MVLDSSWCDASCGFAHSERLCADSLLSIYWTDIGHSQAVLNMPCQQFTKPSFFASPSVRRLLLALYGRAPASLPLRFAPEWSLQMPPSLAFAPLSLQLRLAPLHSPPLPFPLIVTCSVRRMLPCKYAS